MELAERFLERLTGRPRELLLLRTASLFTAHSASLADFVSRELPDLIRVLPSRSMVKRRTWEGGYQGRLDVPATLAYRLAGDPVHFVTRARRRTFELPENLLVCGVARRLRDLATELRAAGLLKEAAWGQGILEAKAALDRLLNTTVLKRIPHGPILPLHIAAARAARHPTYEAALRWHERIERGVDGDDPKAIAELVASGALSPMDDATRFEIAVTVRLIKTLEIELQRRQPGSWQLRRTLVLPARNEVAVLERTDGMTIRFCYNRAVLEPGERDQGAAHYLAIKGRMRPDLTMMVERRGLLTRAVVMEMKLSDNRDYLLQGLQEALLYRWEYRRALTGWPKCILVSSSRLHGRPRLEDDTIAIAWDAWLPTQVTDGLLDGL
jgi:hypothetical protein